MIKTEVNRRTILGGAAASAVAMSVAGGARGMVQAPATSPEFSLIPILDEKQSGHLRHFRNLLSLKDGDWGSMVSDDPTRSGDHTGYQYQISGMVHAMAQAHYHRLPAAPGFFKTDMNNAVQKMLNSDVWNYWFAMSQGSRTWNPDLKGPQTPWWDPVIKENIMYSGHLNHVAALYAYLFNDNQYDKMGSISFAGFQGYGFGSRRADYSLLSLNDHIHRQSAENRYLGVACMPNTVFVTCNQFPLWGLKWQDARLGGSRADEVIAKFIQAWKQYGSFEHGKETPFFWMAQQNHLAPRGWPKVTAAPTRDGYWGASPWGYWLFAGTVPDYMESIYPYYSAAALGRDPQGSLVILSEAEMQMNGLRYGRGAEVLAGRKVPPVRTQPLTTEHDHHGMADSYRDAGIWGWVVLGMSEQGDPRLAEILAYVDANMSPTWEDGGLYYPRNSHTWVDGKFIGVSPTAGNANYGYARLNVKGGLHALLHSSWGEKHFAEPNLSDVSRNVDVVRASFLPDQNLLLLTLRPPHGSSAVPARLEISNVQRQGQDWTLSVGDARAAEGRGGSILRANPGTASFQGDKLVLNARVDRTTDIVLRWD